MSELGPAYAAIGHAGEARGFSTGGFNYEAGQIESLWVLDLDGTVVVISAAAWPEPSAGASPDFAAHVIDSISIDPT